jgi:hypothetical protein
METPMMEEIRGWVTEAPPKSAIIINEDCSKSDPKLLEDQITFT